MWILSVIFAPFAWIAFIIADLKPYWHILIPIIIFCFLWKRITLPGLRFLCAFVIVLPTGILSFLIGLLGKLWAPMPLVFVHAVFDWLRCVSTDFCNKVPVDSAFGMRPLDKSIPVKSLKLPTFTKKTEEKPAENVIYATFPTNK